MDDTVSKLSAAEKLAEEILVEKQQVVDFDRRRNTNREALNQLRKGSLKESRKVWMNFGDVFLKLPHATASSMIEKEQGTIDKTIEDTRKSLHEKSARLMELQGEPMSEGFKLKGMRL